MGPNKSDEVIWERKREFEEVELDFDTIGAGELREGGSQGDGVPGSCLVQTPRCCFSAQHSRAGYV